MFCVGFLHSKSVKRESRVPQKYCAENIKKYFTESSEECDNDCEHCAYIECPKEPCECQWHEKEDNICWNEDKPFIECPKGTSVKHDTVPVKLRINKVSKHISNIDLDELEQEPSEDAVSRQAVLDEVNKKFNEINIILENLPSVQPKAKTGHWKKWEYSTRRCSECDCIVTHEYKFCPDCGAYMIGEK